MEEKRICLVRIKSVEGQRAHLIEKSTFSVGRAQEADLPYLTPSVSRLHLSIELREDGVWVVDPKSANGTFLNGNLLEKGKSYRVDPQDILKLGTAAEEFQLLSIPKPFELLGSEEQKGTFLGSMEELVKQVEKKLETQYKERVEKQIRMAQIEAEEVLSQARKEAEVLKTQGLLELQNRKQQLESEIGQLEQEAKMAAARERLSVRKVADQMIAEAQKRIQKDYDESSEQMEARLRDMQNKCSAMFEQAEEKSQAVLVDAQAEASRVRHEATEEARAIQQESRRKRDESLSTLQAQYQKDVHDKREEILNQSRKEAALERQTLLNEFMQQTEALRTEIQLQEARRSELSTSVVRLTGEHEKTTTELRDMQLRSRDAQQLLTAVEELEKRREQAEREYKHFAKTRDEGLSKLESEMKQLREQKVVEIEESKKIHLNEINKDRLRAIDDIKKEIDAREEDYRKTRKLRAMELTQKLQERVVPRFQAWSQNPGNAGSEFKTAIETAVNECLLNESSIQASVTVQENAATVSYEKRSKKVMTYASVAALIFIVIGSFYHTELMSYMQAGNKDNYASRMIEQRRIQSIYVAPQTDEFQKTYTDNVLSLRGYFEIKTDPDYIEKWTLKLNDLKYLNKLGLSEENVVLFVAKETNLVQQLGVLKSSIDAVYKDVGLKNMRNAEEDAMKEFIPILKGEDKYKLIRQTEKEFLEEYRKTHHK
jgi:hypothetical protein